jgi:hypothetical protein
VQVLDLVEHAPKQAAQVFGMPARAALADFGVGERPKVRALFRLLHLFLQACCPSGVLPQPVILP